MEYYSAVDRKEIRGLPSDNGGTLSESRPHVSFIHYNPHLDGRLGNDSTRPCMGRCHGGRRACSNGSHGRGHVFGGGGTRAEGNGRVLGRLYRSCRTIVPCCGREVPKEVVHWACDLFWCTV